MAEEKEKQDKLLAKLQWMTEQCRMDFKGNPSPFEVKKTQQSVERQREQRAQMQASDVPFLPFNHTKVPLALESTRADYLRGLPQDAFDAVRARQEESAAHVYGPQRQRIDPETGLTEVQRALCWGTPPLRRSVPIAVSDVRAENAPPSRAGAHGCGCGCGCGCCHAQHSHSTSSTSRTAPASAGSRRNTNAGRDQRMDPVALSALPMNERAQAYRDEMQQHPKFTLESAETHSDRWARGSQLSGAAVRPPRHRRAGRLAYRVGTDGVCAEVEGNGVERRTRNPIRMRMQPQ